MAMLPKIVRLNSGLSYRSRWSLALLGFALLALPTWYQEAQSRQLALEAITQPTDSKSTDGKPTDGKPASTEVQSSAATVRGNKGQDSAPANLQPRPGATGGMGGGMGGGMTRRPPISTAVKRPKLPAMASPAVEYFPELSPMEKKIQTALDRVVPEVLSEASLSDMTKLLSDVYEIHFILDKTKLEEEAIDPNKKDIDLHVGGIPLRSWLKLLLEPKGLTFVVTDDVVNVTPKATARDKMIVRTYPVRDLVSNVDVDYALLCRAIQNGVAGDEGGNEIWQEVDGEGGAISIMPATGCLVVRHTWQAHQGVLQLLRALRAANAEAEIKEQHSLTNTTR
jgi:hypothetical protein